MTAHTFTVDDIHRRNSGAVVVVGIQSTEGKVFPASAQVASVLRDASARELSRFLGQLANVDGRGFVVSFTSTMPVSASSAAALLDMISAPSIDATTLTVREEKRAANVERERGESISLEGLGLNIPGAR